jgi:hypothetical protein
VRPGVNDLICGGPGDDNAHGVMADSTRSGLRACSRSARGDVAQLEMHGAGALPGKLDVHVVRGRARADVRIDEVRNLRRELSHRVAILMLALPERVGPGAVTWHGMWGMERVEKAQASRTTTKTWVRRMKKTIANAYIIGWGVGMVGGLYTLGVWFLLERMLPKVFHPGMWWLIIPIWIFVTYVGVWFSAWADADSPEGVGLGDYEPNATDPSAF